MASPDSPTCPTCQAVLALGANGYDTFWSCPNGHGAACTMTAAYGHVQEDEIKAIWQGSKDAAAGERSCPMCGTPMVDVSVKVDADEAEANQPGDGAGAVTASIAVTNLEDGSALQLELPFNRRSRDELDAALDQVRDRYGSAAVIRAASLGRDQRSPPPLLPD